MIDRKLLIDFEKKIVWLEILKRKLDLIEEQDTTFIEKYRPKSGTQPFNRY